MDLITWVVFGLIVGVVANMLDPKPAYGGILGSIVLGVLGAVVGGFLGNFFIGVGVSGFNLPSFALAILGALLLLFLGRMLSKNKV